MKQMTNQELINNARDIMIAKKEAEGEYNDNSTLRELKRIWLEDNWRPWLIF
jgi:hypothetical protein